MRCKKCKAQINKGDKFCRKCGEPVGRRKRPLLIIFFGVLLIVAGCVGVWIYSQRFDEKTVPVDDSGQNASTNYYLSSSTVVSSKAVSESANVMTEKEAMDDFADRGFDDCKLVVAYDIEGDFLVEEEINGSTTERHPYYESIFIDDNARTWVLYSYDGYMMASPLPTEDYGSGPDLIYAEDNYIVSYDSNQNVFYRIIPRESDLIVKQIDRIDADTLATIPSESLSL